MKTSVLIITFERPDFLLSCLESFFGNSIPPGEILVGINGEDPGSLRALGAYRDRPELKIIVLPGLSRGEARNRLLALCAGELAVFIDDDVVVPRTYLEELEKLSTEYPEAEVLGGGQIEGSGRAFFERLSYRALSSFWGSGAYRKRFMELGETGPGVPGDFILCNLAVKKDFLKKNGIKFPGKIASAEENYLLERVGRAGGKMVTSGRLNVFHRHRTGLKAYIRQVFSFGRGRGQLFGATGDFPGFSALPAAFALLILFLLVWDPPAAADLLLAYSAADLLFSLSAGESLAEKLSLFFLFPITHSAHALGVLFGLAEELRSGETKKSL
ncbi:MAG: hypothetical protein COT17_01740 [Elusimicrobia bacterium CG08_land_8_20_14_0_20_51_18]|nr:MAG: hypothetical protein COT17_01740 [Elusimicrobia bacterium CG08_land_8_20_14_0_20_51_18]